MKLFMTPTSPYSRRARIAIIEAGYRNQCEEIDVSPIPENLDTLLCAHPSGKAPTLLLDNGIGLSECILIAQHMNDISEGKLYPKDPAERLSCQTIESIGSVLMDSLFTRSSQNRLDASEQSPTILKKETDRSKRLYRALDEIVSELEGKKHMGALTVACALSYADWRGAEDNWRVKHPRLDAWMKEIKQHQSFATTSRPNA
tara:strand:- start:355 stop:960 length:606 start_codon:yes stop_codon:yes gene_type:complete